MNRPILPPEWARQSGVVLAWPGAETDWSEDLSSVESVYTEIVYQIALRESVLIVCRDLEQREHVQHHLRERDADLRRIRFAQALFNDTWVRDCGPITVLHGDQPRLLDFRFNGWGGRYPAELDNAITARLHVAGVFGAVDLEPVDLVLEGGSIDVDGRGSLLTTSSCLLSPQRNPHFDRNEIEQWLRQHLGVQRILWLEHGHLAGDDTSGHIDTLARFCDPHTIAHTTCDDPADVHYEPLRAMGRELGGLHDKDGRPYRLIPLPLPAPIHGADGQRLPANYANFLIVNEAVLAPTYGDPADAIALRRLQMAFPRRRVIGIDCTPLIRQYGSLHCITMQLPEGVPV